MKKIMMTIAAAFVATAMNAQVYVGGGVGLTTTSHDGDTRTSFKIMPEIGYNLDENWAVGIAFGYAQDKNSTKVNNVEVSTKDKQFQISPYARYTFAKFNNVNLFIDGGLDYIHEDNAGDKWNTFRVGLKPGVAVNLNEKLSFVAHAGFLGYQNYKKDADGAKAYNSFGVGVDATDINFGLYFNF